MKVKPSSSYLWQSALFCAALMGAGVPVGAVAQGVVKPKPNTNTNINTNAPTPEFKEIKWEALVPKGWDPSQAFKGLNLGVLDDSDPRVVKAMRELRETYDNAPTNADLDGRPIKLPGYVVPLEDVKGELSEFLLVPYFGACIHTPPPPANQIIHVTVTKPLKGLRSMDTVWVSGVLKTARQDSSMGTSGYRITTVVLERYVAAERR